MKTWYTIEAKAGAKRVKILVYGYIGQTWDGEGVSSKQFAKDMLKIIADDIDLHINSAGGNVWDGNAIHNILKDHPATIHVTIDALAASIASVIAMAADTITMPENAMLMIHNPSTGVWGTAKDMRSLADGLDKVGLGMLANYRNRSNLSEKRLVKMLDDETWITAAEAVEFGMADTVSGAVDAEARFDPTILNSYKNTPDHIRAAFGALPFEKSNSNFNTFTAATPAVIDNTKTEVSKMKIEIKDVTLAFLNEHCPDLVAAITQAAASTATADVATAERERIQAVLDTAMPGHETLVNTLAFDGATTAPEAAVQILAAEKKIRENAAAALAADAIPPVTPALPPAAVTETPPAVVEDLPVEEQAKAQWDKEPKTRKEFDNDFDGFLAFFKATAAGHVRVLKSK